MPVDITHPVCECPEHAQQSEEIADLRKALWAVIAAGKAVVRDVRHNEKRAMLLGAMMEAERKLNR